MNWLRLAGRSLLAGHFVAQGVAAVRHPAERAAAAEPWVDPLNDLADRCLPPAIRRFFPRSALAWVRCHGLAEAAGGLMVATGLGRRLGALLVVSAQAPHVLAAVRGRVEDAAPDGELAREAALLGAALIEALDTQGKPSLSWRARRARQRRRHSGAGAEVKA
ncbi:MAG: DoxX family membrane protein [Propionibacteriaceae bacterium]|jgi:uncharacterized membrane protein YphA (DoxX/SURF4 family)|nr:DoxX family membrane protein [Propionibacteriaceae bacterium]